MAILTVGAGGEFQTIAAAVAASQDGDTIDVAAGTYTNDFLEFSDSITLQAVGGMVVIDATCHRRTARRSSRKGRPARTSPSAASS